MEQYKKFAKNVGFMGATQILLGVQGFLLLPILTKFLGAADYGIWSQIKITLTLLSSFAMLGLGSAIIRFISGQEDVKKINKEFVSVFSLSILTALFFGVIVFLFSDQIGLLLTHVERAGFFFRFIILMLLLWTIHALFITFFRAKDNIKFFSIIEISRAALEMGAIYLFLMKGYGLFGVMMAFILVRLIVVLFDLFNIRKYIKYVKPSFGAIKPYLAFSLPIAIFPLLSWILQTGDQYIIGYYAGAKAVGIYSLSYSLCRIIRIIADPILLLLQPSLFKAWNQKKMNELKTYFNYSYKYIFMLVIPSVFGLSFLAEPVLKIISTQEFIEGKILMPIIGGGLAVYLLFSMAVSLLMLTKETKKITVVLLTLSVMNIIMNLILVPFMGYLGAAISTLITFLIAGLYGLRVIIKMGMDVMPFFIIKSILCSTIMGLFIFFVRNINLGTPIQKVIVIISFSAPIYFLLLILMKGIKKSEIMFFVGLVLKRFS